MSEAAAERARTLLELGRAAEAIDLLGRALTQDPDSYELLCVLSSAHLQTEEFDLALSIAERAIALEPDMPSAYSLASEALVGLGVRHDEAIRLAIEAVKLGPEEWWTHGSLSSAYIAAPVRSPKHAEYAVAEAHKTVELAPDEPDAHFQVGLVAQELGRAKDAEAAYMKVLAIQPEHALARHNLSVVQLNAGRPFEALAGLRSVAATGQHAQLVHYNIDVLGTVLLRYVYLGAAVLYFVARLAEKDHWSRSVYVAVIASGCVLIAMLVGILALQLPKSMHGYYWRQAARDWGFAVVPMLVFAAIAAILLSAFQESAMSRQSMHAVALALLLASVLARVLYLKRRQSECDEA